MGKKGDFDILNQIKKILKIEMADTRGEKGLEKEVVQEKGGTPRRKMGWPGNIGLAALIGLGAVIGSLFPGCREYDKVIRVEWGQSTGEILKLTKGKVIKDSSNNNKYNLIYVGEKDGILVFKRVKGKPSGIEEKRGGPKLFPGEYTILKDYERKK